MMREKFRQAERNKQKNYVDEEKDDNSKIDKDENSNAQDYGDIFDYITIEENAGQVLNNEQIVNVNNRGG